MIQYFRCAWLVALFVMTLCSGAFAQNSASIRGQFKNLAPEPFTARYMNRDLIDKEIRFTPDETGKFEFKIEEIDDGTYLEVYSDSFRWSFELYVVPSSSLELKADCESPKTMISTMSASGELSNASNYLAECSRDKTLAKMQWDYRTTSMGIDELDQKLVGFAKRKRELLKQMLPEDSNQRAPALARFREIEEANITANRASSLFTFIRLSRLKAEAAENVFRQHIKPILLDPSTMDSVVAGTSVRYLYSNTLAQFKMMRLRESQPELFLYHKGCGWMLMLSDSLYPNGTMKQLAIADSLHGQLNNPYCENSLIELGQYFEKYRDRLNPALQEHVQNEIAKKITEKLGLAAGQPAPAVDFENVNAERISLADHKGKTVLIQVWASWCAPCIETMPEGHEILKKFGESNFALLTVSVDQDKETWKFANQKYLPAGVSIWAKGGVLGEFAKAYGISAVPRYILIDKHGMIVDVFAPLPGSKELEQVLKTLIK